MTLFGHLRKMEESRFSKRTLHINLGKTRWRSKPRNKWQGEVRNDWNLVLGKAWHGRDM